MGLRSAHWLAQEQRRTSFDTGKNTTEGKPTEEINTANNNDMLNAESHPAAGISDFSSNGSNDEGSTEKVPNVESLTIETSPAQNSTKNKSERAKEKTSAKKQNNEKDVPLIEKEVTTDDEEDELEPVDSENEFVLDKTGWSADYDLPL